MSDAIWVAIELRHEGLERYAHKLYSDAGFACLYTVRRWRITSRGRRGKAMEAVKDEWLLPGYLIVAHDGRDEFWRSVAAVTYPKAGTPIMLQPVRVAGCDTIPSRDVRDLIDRCGEQVMPSAVPHIKAEDRVRILADVFAGYTGTVGDVDGDRVSVLVNLFGRPTPVTLDLDKVEKVEAA